jgi:hypothetical protein
MPYVYFSDEFRFDQSCDNFSNQRQEISILFDYDIQFSIVNAESQFIV